MAESEAGTLFIALPERLDRRMRLGPFPSSRDALKFVMYAAGGALLSPFAAAWIWLPVVLAGFALSVWRPDGQALDERLFALVRWKVRSVVPGDTVSNPSASPLVRQGLLQLAPHRYVAVVRTGGSPITYLPPDELVRRFEAYRELIRSSGENFAWLSTTAPIRSQTVRPTVRVGEGRENLARKGYSELVTALCRRRLLRRVYFVVGTLEAGPDAITALEGRVGNLIERLGSLGLRPTRLRDRALADAGYRLGWPAEVNRS
jgi:hypothetical protein